MDGRDRSAEDEDPTSADVPGGGGQHITDGGPSVQIGRDVSGQIIVGGTHYHRVPDEPADQGTAPARSTALSWPRRRAKVVAIAASVVIAAVLVVAAHRQITGPEDGGTTPAPVVPTTTLTPPTTPPGTTVTAAPTTTASPPPPTTRPPAAPTTRPPARPAPSGTVPLTGLAPTGPAVLLDSSETVDQVEGVAVKIANVVCKGGKPGVLKETYDLGGAYTRFDARVSVDDEGPPGAMVVFSVLADGDVVTSVTVSVKNTKRLSTSVAGARQMTLQTSTTTCVTIASVWVESTLTAP